MTAPSLPAPGDTVGSDRLTSLAAEILVRAGMKVWDAAKMARLLVFSQESGIESHGLAHLPAYVAGIAAGSLKARPDIRILSTLPAAAVIDADQAPGALAGIVACDLAIERARSCGIAAVAVRNSAHFGAASAFASRMAEQGMVSLILSNASPTVAPRAAKTALFGTNPIAAGFPRAGADPVIIDFATTVGARGRIRKAAAEGKPIPADWALDAEGQPTTDAKAALQGTMQALGGAKGAVLPLLVELFCVSLSGGNPGVEVLVPQETSARPRGVSHLFVAINAEAFGGLATVAAQTDTVATLVETAVPADPQSPPRMPGVRAAHARAASRERGITVSESLSRALHEARTLSQAIPLNKEFTK